MLRSAIYPSLILLSACSTLVMRQPDGGSGGGGGGGGTSATGGGTSSTGGGSATGGGGIESTGGGSATGGGTAGGSGGGAGGGGGGALISCPVDGGIDGAGVCGQWQFTAWDSVCTDGYTRTRTCDGAYDCRVTDHNGCAAGVNVGGLAPQGCPACPGGRGTLQYFGYWRDSDLQNFVCQIQDHANFTMTNDGQTIVDLAATYGVPNFGLTAPTGGTPAPLQIAMLRDDADVGAFGYCGSNPCPNGIIDGWTAVKTQIENAGSAVKSTNPNAHLMINLGDGDANGQLDFQQIPGFTLPNGVDYVGLECYTGAANCHSNALLVEAMLPAGGKVWVIAAGESGYGSESFLMQDMQDNFNWANADPFAIGMIGFVWSNKILCPPDCTDLAVKELPNLLQLFRTLGDQVTGKSNISPIPDSMCPPP